MSWRKDYAEIVEDLKHAYWSDITPLKWNFIKKDLKKTIRRNNGVDYSSFPPDFRWNLCSARLRQGKFHNWDGWEFRSNWSITFNGYNGFNLKIPRWDQRPVNHLVIACEQGIGDEILYSSAIPEVIVRLGHKAIELQCHPRMIPVFERSFKIRCVWRKTSPESQGFGLGDITEGDAIVALADLFRFYRKDKSHFPKKPYLKPNPERVEYWKSELEKYPKPWIGVAWKSRHGCLPVEELIPKEGTVFNVQYGDLHEGLIELQPDGTEDLDDHLAFISCLDKVVSVTQTVVHECGALGVTCDAIEPPKGTGEVDCGLWYYGLGGPHMIYGSVNVYPSLKNYLLTKR